MENEMSRLQKLGEVMTKHGTDMALALALAILIIGLLVARLIDRGLRKGLHKLWPTSTFLTTLCNVVYIVLVAIVVSAAALEFGAKPINMLRLLTIISLIAVGLLSFSALSCRPCHSRWGTQLKPAACSEKWKQ